MGMRDGDVQVSRVGARGARQDQEDPAPPRVDRAQCRREGGSDEEKKERYREIAAKRLATERLAAHMNVERLAAHLQRVDDRDFNLSYAEYSRAVDAREARDRDMPPASSSRRSRPSSSSARR